MKGLELDAIDQTLLTHTHAFYAQLANHAVKQGPSKAK